MNLLRNTAALIAVLCIAYPSDAADEETLPPLHEGRAPESVDDIWEGFDPRKEPLETEILKEWEDDGVVCRIVRYRIGVFKRTKSMMAGIYAFPKGGKNLPGLVQVHGGGQSANSTTFMAGSTISPGPWRPCEVSHTASVVPPISIIATVPTILSAARCGSINICKKHLPCRRRRQSICN